MGNSVFLWHVEKFLLKNPVFGVLEGRVTEDLNIVGLAYSPDSEIDGHWFIRITSENSPKSFDPIHDRVIGVTSHKDRINSKLYTCVRDYAKSYADKRGLEFIDETLPGQSKNYILG